MQVGTTKDQGLYNKPSAAVQPGALADWTLPQCLYVHTSKNAEIYTPVRNQPSEMSRILLLLSEFLILR